MGLGLELPSTNSTRHWQNRLPTLGPIFHHSLCPCFSPFFPRAGPRAPQTRMLKDGKDGSTAASQLDFPCLSLTSLCLLWVLRSKFLKHIWIALPNIVTQPPVSSQGWHMLLLPIIPTVVRKEEQRWKATSARHPGFQCSLHQSRSSLHPSRICEFHVFHTAHMGRIFILPPTT